MSVLPGDPAVLDRGVAGLRSTTSRIQRAIEDLQALSYESTAKSLDALRAQSLTIAGQLQAVHGRYDGTTNALQEYSVALRGAHDRADRGQQGADRAEAAATSAGGDASLLRRRIHLLEENDAPAGTITTAEDQLRQATQRAAQYDAAADAARAEIEAARRDLEAAAQQAIAKIDTAIDATNEDFWDSVEKFFSDAASFVADLGRWVKDFLAAVVDELQRIVATITAILGAAVILTLLFLLLTAIPVIGPAIAGTVVTFVAALLVARILSDVTKPTPEVTPYTLDTNDKAAYNGQPSSLATALNETAFIDKVGAGAGGNDRSVISVTKVVDADGVVRWRVALPSTQDWITFLGQDAGRTNDLDSNLALMMTPEFRSQYERAVLEAMKQAGVGKDDPVMLVGFSQGGILAGDLAAYNSDYNWSAVVVCGAPIDHMPIPDSTKVVSVQHDGDIVPRLDTIVTVGTDGYAQQKPNWTTIQGKSPSYDDLGFKGIHNAPAYSNTLSDRIGDIPPATVDELDKFFIGDENAYGYKQTFYGWAE